MAQHVTEVQRPPVARPRGNAFPLTIIQSLITAVTFVATAHEQLDDHPQTYDGDVAVALAMSGRGYAQSLQVSFQGITGFERRSSGEQLVEN